MSIKRRKTDKNRWAITDKMFLSLFWTGALIEFSQVGAGFIDGLIISRFLGPAAMAAEGIAHPVFSVLGVLSGLLAVGMQVQCAQALGRGSRDELARFFSASVRAGAIVSVLAAAALLIFVRPLAALLGANGAAAELMQPVSQYLTGVGVGVPALILSAILAPAIQLDSGRRLVQTGALLGSLVNVALDLVAVRLGLGLLGVGLATAISFYVNLACQCTHFRRRERMLRLVRARLGSREFLRMLSIGSDVALKRALNIIRPVVLNAVIIAYGGTAAMSALAVRNNFSDFAEIGGAGLAAAVSLLVGLYFGEVNEEGIAEVRACKDRLLLLVSGSLCLLMLLCARPLARLYVTEEGEILRMVIFAMQMLALQNPLQAWLTCRVKYLQATGRRARMNLLLLMMKLAAVLLAAFVLGRLFGVYGILACYTAGDALSLLAVLAWHAVKKRRLRLSIADLLDLPPRFHLHPGDVISLDIRDLRDVSLASEQLQLFCRGHRVPRRTAYYAALCLEELAANTVQHGFPAKEAAHPSVPPLIDLRAVISGEALTVRLQDNCPYYDVTAQFAAANRPDADLRRNIGIRIVSKTAEDIRYLQTFETNHIVMRFALGKEEG